jgi:zinc transporter ZupT
MNIYFALLAVGVLPVVWLYLLPIKPEFFKKPIVKGFGLGVYSALVFVLLKESFEHADLIIAGGGLLLGFLISFFIGYYFKEFHHHHGIEEHHVHSKVSAVKILISDFLHNIVDGIAIVSGFAINNTVGITSIVGVLGHQIIQQSGQQVLLVEEGLKPKKALFVSFLISLSVFIALFIGQGEVLESSLMAVSAGVILFKILTDIKENKWTKYSVIGFIIGFVLLLGSLLVIPHTH